MTAQTPRLLRGGLTGQIYIVTRYTETPDGMVIADEKHDVTDQFDNLLTEERAQALETAADRFLSSMTGTPQSGRSRRRVAGCVSVPPRSVRGPASE